MKANYISTRPNNRQVIFPRREKVHWNCLSITGVVHDLQYKTVICVEAHNNQVDWSDIVVVNILLSYLYKITIKENDKTNIGNMDAWT